MKPFKLLLIRAPLCMFLMFSYISAGQNSGRETCNFNHDWYFYKGDVPVGQNIGLDMSEWRLLDLPHDWSIEGPFSKEYASCTGYLPGGIGWYRKIFTVPENQKGKKVFIYFNGVYNNSEVWINGNYLGKRPNGYISFQYDLTPWIRFGSENLIAVKVDHTLFGDSRWYTGSGIYRDVSLIVTDPVHIKQWGVYYTTPEISPDMAKLSVEVSIKNETRKRAEVKVTNTLWRGKEIAGSASDDISVIKSGELVVNQIITVAKPALWDIDDPNLYYLVTEIESGRMNDKTTTPVGFRTLRFDAEKGFFLNGRNMKLKGICMHHDAGALGSAVPKQELSRRLDILKELGCNAIRTSHNPFSTDFMELCDQKGFLVIGEAFDEWELPKKKWLTGWNKGIPGKDGYASDFSEWALTDLRDFVLRDRNHPSLIMWSIGNEVDYPNDPYTHPILDTEANPQTWARFDQNLPHGDRLGEIARELVAVIKKLDTSRPVTAGLASALMSNETGYAAALDVAGYNYQEFRYAPDHKKYPDRPLYGSENGMSLEAWNSVADNDYVMGQFLWTGIEYLGEAGQYPSRHSTSGIINLAGNKKPEAFFRQSLWSDKPMVFLGTTDRLISGRNESLWAHKRVDPVWDWEEGKTISVNAFTNCEEVELFLNGRSLGRKKLADFQNRTISWDIPFEPGTLAAVGLNRFGEMIAHDEIKTSGTPVKLITRCLKRTLKADRQDITHVFVDICDEDFNTVYSATNEITCEIDGPVRLLGMEDANPVNIEDYKDNKQHAFRGKLLLYLQSLDNPGKVTVTLTADGLQSATVQLEVVK